METLPIWVSAIGAIGAFVVALYVAFSKGNKNSGADKEVLTRVDRNLVKHQEQSEQFRKEMSTMMSNLTEQVTRIDVKQDHLESNHNKLEKSVNEKQLSLLSTMVNTLETIAQRIS